jgi:hypothetical protein
MPLKKYYARVKCWDTNGKESEWSNVVGIYSAADSTDPEDPPDDDRYGGMAGITITAPTIQERTQASFDVSLLSDLQALVYPSFDFHVLPLDPAVTLPAGRDMSEFNVYTDIFAIENLSGDQFPKSAGPNFDRDRFKRQYAGGIVQPADSDWEMPIGWSSLTYNYYLRRTSGNPGLFSLLKSDFYFEKWAFGIHDGTGVNYISVAARFVLESIATSWCVYSSWSPMLILSYRMTQPPRAGQHPMEYYTL